MSESSERREVGRRADEPAPGGGGRDGGVLGGEALLEAILAGTRDGVVVLDREGTIVRVNEVAERTFAHAMPLVGRRCCDAFHNRSTRCDNCPAERTLATGEIAMIERQVDAGNPDSPWVELRTFPLRDQATGEIAGVVEYARDITARRQTQRHEAEGEQSLHDTLDAISDCVTIYVAVRDTAGSIVDFRTVFANAAACAVWGYTRDQMVGKTISQRSGSFTRSEAFKTYCQVVETGKPLALEALKYVPDGTHTHVRRAYNLRAAKFGDGIILAWTDVTSEAEARELLKQSEQRLRTAVETILDAFALYSTVRNGDGRIVDFRIDYVNGTACAVNGLPLDRQVGRLLSEALPRVSLSGLMDDFIRAVETGEPLVKDAWICEDGETAGATPRALDVRAAKMGDGLAVTWRDITDRKRMEAQLQALTVIDEATGLYNRRGFMTLAQQQIKIADRSKEGVFLLFGDLDNLKSTNDQLGHREGDRIISDTAQVLRSTFRDADIMGRIGGDEFVVLMTDVRDITPDQLSARFRKAVEAHNRGPGASRISISFGIASYDPAAPCSFDALLKRADGLMYEEKRRKRAAKAQG